MQYCYELGNDIETMFPSESQLDKQYPNSIRFWTSKTDPARQQAGKDIHTSRPIRSGGL